MSTTQIIHRPGKSIIEVTFSNGVVLCDYTFKCTRRNELIIANRLVSIGTKLLGYDHGE